MVKIGPCILSPSATENRAEYYEEIRTTNAELEACWTVSSMDLPGVDPLPIAVRSLPSQGNNL